MLFVMVVDDDELLRRVLVRGLGGACSVRAVESAEEALEALGRGERFDLILLDLSVSPAEEFVRRVRAAAEGQEHRVALFTGVDAIEPEVRACVAGRVLEKPSSFPDILALAQALRESLGPPRST